MIQDIENNATNIYMVDVSAQDVVPEAPYNMQGQYLHKTLLNERRLSHNATEMLR